MTPHGRVLEGPTWTFFWVAGGRLLTPPLEDHILASITRAYLLEECDARSSRARSTTSRRPRRRSSPRPCARSCRSRTIDEPRACPRRPGRSALAAAGERLARRIEASWRARRALAARRDADVRRGLHGHREPPAVRQGRGGLGPAARGRTGGAGPHGPALRRRAVAGLLRRAGAPAAGPPSRARRRQQHRADGADAGRAGAAAAAERPDVLLVYGDTNSTLAGALAGAQARRAGGPRRGGHAVLRPCDAGGAQPRPRRPRGDAAAVLVASSRRETCAASGWRARSCVVGDVMVDVALMLGPRARSRTRAAGALRRRARRVPARDRAPAGNVDDPARLERLVELLLALPGPVVLPLHPRTRARLEAAGLLERLGARRAARAAARLPRLHGAAASRARGADRLRRRAEGGLPGRRAVRDAARRRPSGPRRSTPAGTCSSTSTPTPRWPRSSGRSRRAAAALRRRRAGERVVEALRTAVKSRHDGRIALASDRPPPTGARGARLRHDASARSGRAAGGDDAGALAGRHVLAGWWSRVGAALIDGVIIGVGARPPRRAHARRSRSGFFAARTSASSRSSSG